MPDNPSFRPDEGHVLQVVQPPPNGGSLHKRGLRLAQDSDLELMPPDPAKGEDTTSPHPNVGNGIITRYVDAFWGSLGRFYDDHRRAIQVLVKVTLNVVLLLYFATAMWYFLDCQKDSCPLDWCNGFGMLVLLVVIFYVTLVYFVVVKRFFGKAIYKRVMKPAGALWDRLWGGSILVRLAVYLVPLGALIAFLAIDTAGSRERLVSFLGMVVLLFLGFIFSKHPGQIRWRPVLWGLTIQFVFGLLTIRWAVGRSIFQCVGDKVATFLAYTDAGSSFVYGDLLVTTNKVFAFQVMPVIFFFCFVIQILYYYGAMQAVVVRLGWLLQISLGTTVCESVNAAASTFLGMSEAPLLIQPYIKDLTRSEIHALMTGGFATVAGTVMAAYISFGVEPAHLITASVMSAPAALCYAKLFYPETEETKNKVKDLQLEKGTASSVLDAATRGTIAGIDLVMGILANIIAFVAFVAFLNGILAWLGELVGVTSLSFEYLLGKVFIPLAWLMGVEPAQCEDVGQLVGLKTVVNEFVAYQKMGELKRAGRLTPRSEAIATYALCGFSNPAAVGILIGSLSALAPNKRPEITDVAVRAFVAGSATCFLTACIAGILMTGENYAGSTTAAPGTNATLASMVS